ncbi:ABC transporter permease [Nonomuraea sp. NPDC050663]|uniref:ABC transporter permease n=1 Tax=Nonomuraea sp. NPDC050663 TaxID=3364370 RepID=UPI003787706C
MGDRPGRQVRFLAKRLAGLATVLLVASFSVYGLLYLVPGGPLGVLLGPRTPSPEVVAAVKREWRLDEPFLVRYWLWLTDALGGDLGRSIVYKSEVASLIGSRATTTALLVLYAITLIVLGGVLFGTLAALRGGWVDTLISALSSAVLAVPAFVVGVVLVIVFALTLGWFPVFGPGDGFGDRIHHLTLPAITLALGIGGYLARITRTSVGGELRSEHVETARSRGLREGPIIRRHVLRNAAIPVVTVTGVNVAGLIASSVVVENIFALDGLGSLFVRAILQRDFAIVQGVVLVLVTAFVLVNLLVDLCCKALDPRLPL